MAFPFGRKEIEAPQVEDGKLPLHTILYSYEIRKVDCGSRVHSNWREDRPGGQGRRQSCKAGLLVTEYGRPRKKLKMK